MLDSRLNAFIAVAEHGSFTRAAQALSLSRSRVSQLVTVLEATLGVTLIHRSTRHVRVTPEGQAFYSECTRASTILTLAQSRINEDQMKVAGHIRLNSVGGIFAEKCLAPALSAFLVEYPEVDLEVDFSSQRVDLMADNYDIVIRMGALEDSSLIARPLTPVHTYVVASPIYLSKKGQPDNPITLVDHHCLCGSVNKWRFIHSNTGQTSEVLVSGHLHSPNGYVLRQAAIDGLGIVRLNHWYVHDALAQNILVPVFKNWHIISHPVSLLYRQVKYQTRRVQLLVDFLVQYFDASN